MADHFPDDDVVMSVSAWAEMNSLALVTARRLIANGQGPEIIQLSPNRLGITRRADRAWKAARTISASTA